MKKGDYYVKSFEDDFVLKTIKGNKKVDAQSLKDIVKSGNIKPNTISFGKKKRLACTFLHKNYLKSYRSQGLIFQTDEKPDSVYPFDIVVLTNAKKMIVQYYRIENKLQEYYGHELISGFENFMFNSPGEMFKKISSPKDAFEKVNKFRVKAGFRPLLKSKFKLIEYNECIFNRAIKVSPVAVFGYGKEARDLARELGLPWFRNVKSFYESL